MRRSIFTVLAIACGLFTLLLAFVTWVALTETLSVRDTPLPATMAEGIRLLKSGKSAWVQLTDANADCQRYAPFANNRDDGVTRQSGAFIATNAEKNIEIAAVVHDIAQCDYLGRVHFIGVIKELDTDERKKFAADGLPLSETTGPNQWLCTWCVPEREWLGVIVLLVLVCLAGFGTRMLWRKRIVDAKVAGSALPQTKRPHSPHNGKKGP